MSSPETDVVQRNVDFGAVLASARKANNLTLDDICEHLKIPLHVLKEIEANDLDALPPPTFTQGYIRAYAKYLEISEDSVLEIYNRAVPHDQVSDLKPRSNLPGEASSQSLIVKIITMLLILAGLTAMVVGSYQYYQEKAGVMESERESMQKRFTGHSLDSPGNQSGTQSGAQSDTEQPLEIRQNARLSDDGELIVEQSESDPFESMSGVADDVEETVVEGEILVTAEPAVTESEAVVTKPAKIKAVTAKSANKINPKPVDVATDVVETDDRPAVIDNESDIIEIIAEQGSWVKVIDATNKRLLYNTVPVGGRKVLVGHAPFSVSMGNADSTRVVVNNVDVDVSAYIRPNNIAHFKVSTQGRNIVFH